MIDYEEYTWEIKSALLLLAERIRHIRGENVAEHFIGFPPDNLEYGEESINKMDLEEFGGGGFFWLLYHFAVGSVPFAPSGDMEKSELRFIINLLRYPEDIHGEEKQPPEYPICQKVLDLVIAREKLSDAENKPSFTVHELALLADMTEGGVRNALSNKELTSRREDGRTVIDWEKAIIWLPKKRGFRPTPELDKEWRLVTTSSLEEFLTELEGIAKGKQMPINWRQSALAGDIGVIARVASDLELNVKQVVNIMAARWIAENVKQD